MLFISSTLIKFYLFGDKYLSSLRKRNIEIYEAAKCHAALFLTDVILFPYQILRELRKKLIVRKYQRRHLKLPIYACYKCVYRIFS